MRPFEYLRPGTEIECFALLDEWGPEAEVLSGGTDLLMALKAGSKHPAWIVDIKSQPVGAPGIRAADGAIRIGARTTMAAVAGDLARTMPALAEAARIVGSPSIRRRATIGGNIAQASPSAEVVPALVALDAALELRSAAGTRLVPVSAFATGPHRTVRRPTELLHEIVVPRPGAGRGAAYLRFTPRRAIDIAIVNVAVSLRVSPDGTYTDSRIALGAVAPTVIRSPAAEAALDGQRASDTVLRRVSELAAADARPIDDVRGSAAYRRGLVAVLVRRAIAIAVQRAGGGVSGAA
jgi:carbon-monoxide dehydrogenase medium subunit